MSFDIPFNQGCLESVPPDNVGEDAKALKVIRKTFLTTRGPDPVMLGDAFVFDGCEGEIGGNPRTFRVLCYFIRNRHHEHA